MVTIFPGKEENTSTSQNKKFDLRETY